MATGGIDEADEMEEDLDAEYDALVRTMLDQLDEPENVVDEFNGIKVKWIPGVGLVDDV